MRRHGTEPKAVRVFPVPAGLCSAVTVGRYGRTVRRATAALAILAALALAGAAGCTSDSGAAAAPSPTASPTYLLAPRTARPFETPLPTASATGPQVTVSVVGLRVHLLSIIGTHAEWLPKGEYERLRIALDNGMSTFRAFDTRKMLLVDANGKTYLPDYDAMRIARQPTVATVPAEGRLEMDLWFDLPEKSIVRALRVQDLDKDIALPGI
jgi:hypothetical protein